MKKEQKIIPFVKKTGKRTSITLSNFQLEVLKGIAEYEKKSKYKILQEFAVEADGKNLNLSSHIRDCIMLKLLNILSSKGVNI